MSQAANALTLFSLAGRSAVVTGAASGIGRAIAVGLADAGADVGCLDRSREGLADTVATMADRGRRAHSVAADVTDELQLDAALSELENTSDRSRSR